MQFFLRFLIVSCVALSSWLQVEARLGSSKSVAILLAGMGALAVLLTAKGSRLGLWFSLVLSLAYAAGVVLSVPPEYLREALPFLSWCALATLSCTVLLWSTGERSPRKKPTYERYPQY